MLADHLQVETSEQRQIGCKKDLVKLMNILHPVSEPISKCERLPTADQKLNLSGHCTYSKANVQQVNLTGLASMLSKLRLRFFM